MNLKHNPGTWMHHIYIISLSVNYLNLSEQKYKSDMKNYYIICLYIIYILYLNCILFWYVFDWMNIIYHSNETIELMNSDLK